ncbi:MAG: hypothetical protein AAF380_02870, partial [Bacteroidota bacterium]
MFYFNFSRRLYIACFIIACTIPDINSAANDNDVEEINALNLELDSIRKKVDPSNTLEYEHEINTLLRKTLVNSSPKVLRYALEGLNLKEYVNKVDREFGKTLLSWASDYKLTDHIPILLENGASANDNGSAELGKVISVLDSIFASNLSHILIFSVFEKVYKLPYFANYKYEILKETIKDEYYFQNENEESDKPSLKKYVKSAIRGHKTSDLEFLFEYLIDEEAKGKPIIPENLIDYQGLDNMMSIIDSKIFFRAVQMLFKSKKITDIYRGKINEHINDLMFWPTQS